MLRFVAESGYRGSHFVDHVHEFAAGMERQMTWSGAGGDLRVLEVRIRHQHAGGSIELPGPHAVCPKVRAEDKCTSRIEQGLVGVRRLLALSVRAVTGDREHIGSRPEPTVS